VGVHGIGAGGEGTFFKKSDQGEDSGWEREEKTQKKNKYWKRFKNSRGKSKKKKKKTISSNKRQAQLLLNQEDGMGGVN